MQSKSPVVNPNIALISGVLAVSTGAIFVRTADAPALVIAAYRVGLATLILAPFAWWKAGAELRALSRNEALPALLAGLFLALHFAAWISSLDYTSVANSVVLVNTNPLWVALLTPLVTKDRINPRIWISILVTVTGGVVIGAGDVETGGAALWGDALALCGSVCAAMYLLLGRRLRSRLSLLAYVIVCYGTAAGILWAVVLVCRMPVTGFSSATVASFWAMAVIPQIIGHSSYNWALKWFSAGVIAVSLLGEPIGSTLLAYFIFDEGVTMLKLVGGGMILAGIYLAAVGEH